MTVWTESDDPTSGDPALLELEAAGVGHPAAIRSRSTDQGMIAWFLLHSSCLVGAGSPPTLVR